MQNSYEIIRGEFPHRYTIEREDFWQESGIVIYGRLSSGPDAGLRCELGAPRSTAGGGEPPPSRRDT
jgi:hypothetical protein